MRESTTRRRFLALAAGTGTVGLAGCSGSDTDTAAPATDTASPATGDGTAAGQTGHTSPEATDTPTEAPVTDDDSEQEFRADFSNGLANFAVVEDGAGWTTEERIDGRSAHVDASGDATTSVLARTGGFEWLGTGGIECRVQVDPAADRNDLVFPFGDLAGGDAWRVVASLAGEQSLRIESPGGESVSASVDVDASETTWLFASVATGSVAASVGGQSVRFEDPERLPEGTVGIGILSDADSGGRAWFDGFAATSEE